MFSSKSETNKSMHDHHGIPTINMISEGTRITGSLSTKSDFRVSGEVEGTIHVDGKCIVSSTAVIKGDIIATDADVAGKVEGELVVRNKLILRQSGYVYGDIQTKVLLVEEGAKFEGACHMSSNPSKRLNIPAQLSEDDKSHLKLTKAVNE